jgi:peroxiredoxin
MLILLKRFALPASLVLMLLGGWTIFVRSTAQPEASAAAPATDNAHNSPTHQHATAEEHKQCAVRVVGKPLPELLLKDARGFAFNPTHTPNALNAPQVPNAQNSPDASKAAPVLLVRYLGYSCSHCIQQLLALQKHSAALKRSGIRVIAFSEDSAEDNAVVIAKYKFDTAVFTFATDPDNAAGRALGAVYKEKDGSETELHISLVLRDGVVAFAAFDSKPFMDIPALLNLLSVAS